MYIHTYTCIQTYTYEYKLTHSFQVHTLNLKSQVMLLNHCFKIIITMLIYVK